MRYPKCARPHVSDSPFVTKLHEVLHAKTIRRCISISPRYLDVIKSIRLFSCFPFCGLFSAIKSLRLSTYVQYLRYRRQLRANRRRDDASHHPSSFRLCPFPLSFSLSFSLSLLLYVTGPSSASSFSCRTLSSAQPTREEIKWRMIDAVNKV